MNLTVIAMHRAVLLPKATRPGSPLAEALSLLGWTTDSDGSSSATCVLYDVNALKGQPLATCVCMLREAIEQAKRTEDVNSGTLILLLPTDAKAIETLLPELALAGAPSCRVNAIVTCWSTHGCDPHDLAQALRFIVGARAVTGQSLHLV